jgi:hypothetical protein
MNRQNLTRPSHHYCLLVLRFLVDYCNDWSSFASKCTSPPQGVKPWIGLKNPRKFKINGMNCSHPILESVPFHPRLEHGYRSPLWELVLNVVGFEVSYVIKLRRPSSLIVVLKFKVRALFKMCLRICNSYWFSTATMVRRNLINVRLYLHCVSCFIYHGHKFIVEFNTRY